MHVFVKGILDARALYLINCEVQDSLLLNMFILNDFGYYWLRVFRISVSAILVMTIYRAILIVRTPLHWPESITKDVWVEALIMGIRFDVLVWSFLLIPVFVITIPLSINLGNWILRFISKIYILTVWLFLSVLSVVDSFYFVHHYRRLRLGDYQTLLNVDWLSHLSQAFHQNTLTSFLFVCAFLIGFLGIAQNTTKQPNSQISTYAVTRNLIVWNLIWPFFILALCARNSVGAQHLRMEDSQLTDVESFNELIVNSPWIINKTPKSAFKMKVKN